MAVAGYLIEKGRRWPVITASPWGQRCPHRDNIPNKFWILKKAHSGEETVPVAWLD